MFFFSSNPASLNQAISNYYEGFFSTSRLAGFLRTLVTTRKAWAGFYSPDEPPDCRRTLM